MPGTARLASRTNVFGRPGVLSCLKGIQLAALHELCNAGAVRGGGFALKARYGLIERTLMAKRGQVRVFRSLDSLAELARFELGIGRLGIELADLRRRP